MKDCNGVYTIRNRYVNRIYVGSAQNIIAKRWSKYKSELQRGIYKNKKLQTDFNEYGISAFEWTIEQECEIKDLRKLEKQYKQYYKDLGFELYNCNEIHTLEVKKQEKSEKMCKAQQGENNPRCRLSKEDIFEILDMLEDGVKRETIAEKFEINENYISRIGKDRRIQEYKEWEENKEKEIDCTAILSTSSSTPASVHM